MMSLPKASPKPGANLNITTMDSLDSRKRKVKYLVCIDGSENAEVLASSPLSRQHFPRILSFSLTQHPDFIFKKTYLIMLNLDVLMLVVAAHNVHSDVPPFVAKSIISHYISFC